MLPQSEDGFQKLRHLRVGLLRGDATRAKPAERPGRPSTFAVSDDF
jgi:hypothetical protein